MQTIRKRILNILKRRRQATVGELARQLDMAPVSVRYHLDILQGENLIEVSKVRREGNVGRPRQVYALTGEADEHFPDNFGQLTIGLVHQLKKALPPEQVDDAFRAIAREMAADLTADVSRMPWGERMDQVADFLNERGYFARWESREEEGGDTYLLHTHNCPYTGVSGEHPELCCMDLALMSELVGRPCERVDSIAEAGNCCSYRIRPEEAGHN